VNKKDLFHFGFILKTQGFKGHLIISMDVDHPARYQKLETICLEDVNGNLEEVKLAYYELHKNKTCTILPQGIDSFESAQAFLKKKVYLPLSLLPTLDQTSFYFHEIPGFTVMDKNLGEVGLVQFVVESPGQDILQIKKDRTEILVPLKREFILSIDREKKILHINAPEGLIEMYLGKQGDEEE
jgi:16S rRNA processing protein RimM